ncbi:17399_t:CDS:2 [Racocetra fulgida]|uniref:17399_t:CDS:1 n=1 Tax=Racocetra fulgida TaxID=60492 RepID=A0A9N9G0N7_9GLOM|nr:17399_t:CDS:2 [Racocetra fulgida]
MKDQQRLNLQNKGIVSKNYNLQRTEKMVKKYKEVVFIIESEEKKNLNIKKTKKDVSIIEKILEIKKAEEIKKI